MFIKYFILVIYFGILFLIGFLASRRIKGAKDYYVGGKNMGYWVVAFSSRATGESAWLLLGLTGMGAMIGVQAFWVVLGEMIGVSVAWFLMARPFKKLSDEYDSITIPDYLTSRFGSKSHLLRIISATVLSVFVIIYVSAQIDATGAAFEAFLEWDYFLGAIVGFVIVLAYIFTGGFVAVAWSDLFQGLIMLAGLVLLPIVAWMMMDDGQTVSEGLNAIDPNLLSFTGGDGWTLMTVMTILGLALIGLGFMGSPQVFVRFMSIKNDGEIKKGRWVAFFYTLLSDSAAVGIGILGRLALTEVGDNPEGILGQGGEDVLPLLVEKIMPLTLVGIYIAAVLSAIMSTIDSLLVVASSAITRDFYQQIYRPHLHEKDMARISRIVTLVMALVALGIAMTVAILTPGRTVFWFVIFGWSGIAATFCPMMILSLFWRGYNEAGAIASMITGFACVPFFKFVAPTLGDAGPYFKELAELPPSFAMAMLVGAVVSLLTRKKSTIPGPKTA